MNLHEIKQEHSERIHKAMTRNGVFWAFNNKQFLENKTPLMEGEKYVSIGAGGYMPKSKIDQYLLEMKAVKDWFKRQTAKGPNRRKLIEYELNNHECYYIGDIEPAIIALGEGYTYNEVLAVYNEVRQTIEVY